MLRFRLARTLGMTLAEMDERMSAREFWEWARFIVWEHEQQQDNDHKQRAQRMAERATRGGR